MKSKQKSKIIVSLIFFSILLCIGFILASRLDKENPVRTSGYRTDFNPNIVDSIEKRTQEKMGVNKDD